ncbi:cytochrome P450 9e2-like [Copidosoma floridanum]|uniref:cytochrome P450 9e2-like n=1 Tax=Copidosoma floridanum TaxID=29053 RepID=UPI0006C9747D|nr:cytochrome P450 9e2-like [Copidosoma floridanum]
MPQPLRMVYDIKQKVAKCFEAKDAFSRYTSDVIASAAYGVKFNSMNDKENEFYSHGKTALSFTFLSTIKFELLTLFPRLMRLLGATFFPRRTDEFFKNIIKGTVKIRKEQGIVRQDMIHLLMLAMERRDGIEVTLDDIVGQAFFFFLAGFDTSSSLMCFIAHELAANLHIQERLYEEIEEQTREDGGKVTYDSLSKMKYLDMVASETLRKYPVAPFTNRVCTKDHVLPPPMEGYPECSVERGMVLLLPIFGLHRDPKYFPKPDKFDPERFSDENRSKIEPYTYMPFGIGLRQCIGNRFALMEAKIVIIDLVRKFVIKFTEKSRDPIIFGLSNFNLTAKDGFWLKLEERKKTN